MEDTPFTFKVHIELGQAGLRLDQCRLSGLSRSRLKALIMQGHVKIDNVTVNDPAARMRRGQEVRVAVPVLPKPEPQGLPLNIVYEDMDLVVIDKSPGMIVHPPTAGTQEATIVNALLARYGVRLSKVGGVVGRSGIVHRLDKNTSGLLVVAKTDRAHHSLTAQFADHQVDRIYKAVVWGVPQTLSGVITGHVGRHPTNRKKMAMLQKGGKAALTYFKVVKTFCSTASIIECCLATGRTHQIRVHMTSMGHPLIGDLLYSSGHSMQLPQMKRLARKLFPRQALHACFLRLDHPRTGNKLCFESKLPFDIKELINFLELN
ncbi:Ribosomal large subunit pseudouridine synthase D [invertebrate metagenome]|uniref:Ribosomal large subunit pseudouridine synthase D n=1 Tax=invertebrate metagenome TaxID=1711999 RepID=A0A484H9M0_9ZZZZ